MARWRMLVGVTVALVVLAAAGSAGATGWSRTVLRGTVESADIGLAGYQVSLYARFVDPPRTARVLGRAVTGPAGAFRIEYQVPGGHASGSAPLLFVRARSGSAIWPARSDRAGHGSHRRQRSDHRGPGSRSRSSSTAPIDGNKYGMLNAVRMAANMADPSRASSPPCSRCRPRTVPRRAPLQTFNALANVVASCVGGEASCQDLFEATRPARRAAPGQHAAGPRQHREVPVAQHRRAFDLSLGAPIYTPALAQAPDAWTLFLKFTGSFSQRPGRGTT